MALDKKKTVRISAPVSYGPMPNIKSYLITFIVFQVIIVLMLGGLYLFLGLLTAEGIKTTGTVSAMFSKENVNRQLSSAMSNINLKPTILDALADPAVEGIIQSSISKMFSGMSARSLAEDSEELVTFTKRIDTCGSFDACGTVRSQCRRLSELLQAPYRNQTAWDEFLGKVVTKCMIVNSS